MGEVEEATIESLIKEGQDVGRKVSLTRLSRNSAHSTIKSLSKAIASGDATTKDVEGMKPVFRLHPPRDPRDGGASREHTQSEGLWDSEERRSATWQLGCFEVIIWFREQTNSEAGADITAEERRQEEGQEKEEEGAMPA